MWVSLHADLASVHSSLDQLLERLAEVASELEGSEQEDLTIDVYEVERHIKSASRRLLRTVQTLETMQM